MINRKIHTIGPLCFIMGALCVILTDAFAKDNPLLSLFVITVCVVLTKLAVEFLVYHLSLKEEKSDETVR